MNNTKEILNKARTLLGIQVKFEQMKLDNGAVLEAESFEVGAEVFVVADEERVAVPIGEYLTEDGMAILISEEGIIADIKKVEDAPEEEETPVVEEEQELEKEAVNPKKIVESVSTETFFAEIEKLQNEINELKLGKVEVKEVEEVKVELKEDVKLSEVEGISHNPENVSNKKELNLYSQKGKQSITSKIFKQLNK